MYVSLNIPLRIISTLCYTLVSRSHTWALHQGNLKQHAYHRNTRKFISTFKAIKLHTKTNLQKYFLPPRFLKNIEDKSRKLCNVGQSKYLDRNTSRKKIATQLAESDAITQPSGTQTAYTTDSKMPTHPRKKRRKNAVHIYICTFAFILVHLVECNEIFQSGRISASLLLFASYPFILLEHHRQRHHYYQRLHQHYQHCWERQPHTKHRQHDQDSQQYHPPQPPFTFHPFRTIKKHSCYSDWPGFLNVKLPAWRYSVTNI